MFLLRGLREGFFRFKPSAAKFSSHNSPQRTESHRILVVIGSTLKNLRRLKKETPGWLGSNTLLTPWQNTRDPEGNKQVINLRGKTKPLYIKHPHSTNKQTKSTNSTLDQRSSQPLYTKKHKGSGSVTPHNHQLNSTTKTCKMHSRCGNLIMRGGLEPLLKFWLLLKHQTTKSDGFIPIIPEVEHQMCCNDSAFEGDFFIPQTEGWSSSSLLPRQQPHVQGKKGRVWASLNTRLLFMFLNLDVARVHGWIRPWRSTVERQIKKI